MTRKHVSGTLGLAGLVWACLLAAPARGNQPDLGQAVITSVTVDMAGENLTIRGLNLGGQPRVGLALTELQVLSASPEEIVVALPPGLEPGTYLLAVARGHQRHQVATIDITIGATGPEGPPGPGKAGADRTDRATGADRSPGGPRPDRAAGAGGGGRR
jgi:hypothetical protein